jgi:phospholipid-binding lipoprotein MlaA
MQIIKNYRHIFLALTLILFTTNIAKSTEECFEGTSRAIFKFNMALDDIVFEPLAKGYNKLPSPIKTGTSNFTSNIGTLLSIPNNVLQGNFQQLGHSIGSFALNSTVGVFGILNPAEKIGLKPNKEDVGQTLGSYGIGPGCYLVLPVLGSTTVRDTFGMLADTFVDPFAHVTIREKELLSSSGNSLDFYSIKATTAIDFRADNDKNFESLEKNSIDLYSSIKSIYLQDRENKIKNSIKEEDDWGNLNN